MTPVRVRWMAPASVPPARMMSRWTGMSPSRAVSSSSATMAGWQMTEESITFTAAPRPSRAVPARSEPGVSSTSVTSTATA